MGFLNGNHSIISMGERDRVSLNALIPVVAGSVAVAGMQFGFQNGFHCV
jgi:hypothetical protein